MLKLRRFSLGWSRKVVIGSVTKQSLFFAIRDRFVASLLAMTSLGFSPLRHHFKSPRSSTRTTIVYRAYRDRVLLSPVLAGSKDAKPEALGDFFSFK